MKRIIKKLSGLFKGDLDSDSAKYWDLSSYDPRVQDYSHWCGSPRWDEARWLSYGERNVNLALERIGAAEGPSFLEQAAAGAALEWGCGGGPNIIALSRRFPRVWGLEIAAPTLEECRRQVKMRGGTDFSGILIESGRPESALKMIEKESLDFILSIEVFQHFPSKDYTARVLRVMNAILKRGALAWVQIRDFDGSSKLRQKETDYAANMIYMTSFTVGEFTRMIEDCGFSLLWHGRDESVEGDDHAYYLLRKAFPKGNPTRNPS
jgi:SAM-dependent methyltransferase